MRYLILSDLHANYEALRAILESAEGDYEQVVCCGDLVGYGPDPNAVTDWVRANVASVVRGNHDRAAVGLLDEDDFNDIARFAVTWTHRQLTPENQKFLRTLPQGPLEVESTFQILHGSPRDEDEYVTDFDQAAELFELLPHSVTFFGHTHLQGGFVQITTGDTLTLPMQTAREKPYRLLEIRSYEKYYLNPGSVGQPRDRDARAAFAIYDTRGHVEFWRVPYNIENTMRKMEQAGLPEFLRLRLLAGR